MQNIGLIGLGFIGKAHLRAYQHIANVRVKMICTRDKEKIKQITNEIIPGCQPIFVTDFDDLLANQDIDMIDICLPTYLHEEYIIKAANAGKHIICEKPLTLTVESAKRIIDEVKRNDVRLFVGHVLRFWPEYQMIKSYSQTDKLKDIDIVHAKRLGQAPKWSDWFQDPKKSGGALFDLHIHDIDYIYHLLGEIASVYAVGHRNNQGAWDHVMTVLNLKNNSKAFVEASHRMPIEYPFTMSFRVQAVQGTLNLHIAAGENIENIDDSKNQFFYYTDKEATPVPVVNGNAFQNELAYFVDCVQENKDNKVIPLNDVLYTLKIMEAIETSLETGQEVEV